MWYIWAMSQSKIMKVRRHHNYPMVIIPQKILEAALLKIGDYVLVEALDEEIRISKINVRSKNAGRNDLNR